MSAAQRRHMMATYFCLLPNKCCYCCNVWNTWAAIKLHQLINHDKVPRPVNVLCVQVLSAMSIATAYESVLCTVPPHTPLHGKLPGCHTLCTSMELVVSSAYGSERLWTSERFWRDPENWPSPSPSLPDLKIRSKDEETCQTGDFQFLLV